MFIFGWTNPKKNEVEKQLADIKNTLFFERNTRRTLGLSECAWQTGCSTTLNTAVIQNTWNTCFYLGSVSEQEHIFHSCSLVYGNFNPFTSHFGNMRHLKELLRMKQRPQKRGKSAWGKKTICLQMVLPRKHYSTYAHAGGPRHATQTDVFDRTASSLVALVINLMVTDFYLETPHCLETSKSRCCYVSCRRPLFSAQEHCWKIVRVNEEARKNKNAKEWVNSNSTIYHPCALEHFQHC